MSIKGVFFDVGETLVDETRQWGEWAHFLGVTRLAFFGALGAVIERQEHHRKVFEYFGVSFRSALLQREKTGWKGGLEVGDFYPDALPCLQGLKAAGYLVGISGNQPERNEATLRAMGLPIDFLASSTSWGVEKPDPRFFKHMVQETGLEPEQIAYVGDRIDNDVLPALKAGMKAVFIRRGPWGYIHATWPEAGRATLRIESLEELAGQLKAL